MLLLLSVCLYNASILICFSDEIHLLPLSVSLSLFPSSIYLCFCVRFQSLPYFGPSIFKYAWLCIPIIYPNLFIVLFLFVFLNNSSTPSSLIRLLSVCLSVCQSVFLPIPHCNLISRSLCLFFSSSIPLSFSGCLSLTL